jgi:phosphonate metabolism-associated iron-containing alcohol dehydrogenase
MMLKAIGGGPSEVLDVVDPNPNIDNLDAAHNSDALKGVDLIIALGGGSAIDTAKILSAIASSENDYPLSDHFRKGAPIDTSTSIPVVAIPTTAGTGSEVTPTATVWDYQQKRKHSLSGTRLFPSHAILDPNLTTSLPESISVSSGLDAISHALESVWNKNSNPISTTLATQSLRLSLEALPKVRANGTDIDARSAMMIASLKAGMAISQTRTALAHSISYPITIELEVPHGIACSFALPEILEFNSAADDGRLETLSENLGFDNTRDLQTAISDLLGSLSLPVNYFREPNTIDRILTMKDRMITSGRFENNLRQASSSDIERILESAIERYGIHVGPIAGE